jgi:hypothetical protein
VSAKPQKALLFVKGLEIDRRARPQIDMQTGSSFVPPHAAFHRGDYHTRRAYPAPPAAGSPARAAAPLAGEVARVPERPIAEITAPELLPPFRSIFRPMFENTSNAAWRRLGYSKHQMTAHGFKGMASTRLNEMGCWIQMPSSVNLHTRNRTMFGALTCTQPNTGRSASG